MEIMRPTYRHSDAVHFVSNAITALYGEGATTAYLIGSIVDDLHVIAGGYDLTGLVGEEFWPVVRQHRVVDLTSKQTPLARSYARTFIETTWAEHRNTWMWDKADYDIEAMVTELVDAPDNDYFSMSGMDFEALLARHEKTAPEPTDEELIAAIARSRTGWGVLVKDGAERDMIELRNPNLTTEEAVHAHLSTLLSDGIEFRVFPLIG